MRLLIYLLIVIIAFASLAYGLIEIRRASIIYNAQGECISTYIAQGVERSDIRRTDTWCEVVRPE